MKFFNSPPHFVNLHNINVSALVKTTERPVFPPSLAPVSKRLRIVPSGESFEVLNFMNN